MKRAAVILLSLGCEVVCAQQPGAIFKKAPPAVEAALKERAVAFWTAQAAKKYRVADQYVAEDSKDAFIGVEKPDCRTWEYQRANFEPGFKKAQVLFNCETSMAFGGPPVWIKRPINTFWTLIDGKWYWTMPPKPKEFSTPFGMMKVRENETPGTPPPADALKVPTSVGEMLDKVQVSRKALQLKAFASSSEEITVSNNTGIGISLSAKSPDLSGFTVQIGKAALANGESTTVIVRYSGAPGSLAPNPLTVPLRIDPFGQDIAITVKFQ